MTIDSFYTSASLADTLTSFGSVNEPPATVADFACGGGSLLLAAERRWPGIRVLANDISRAAISKLKRTRSNWQFSAANFLEQRSIRSSRIYDSIGNVDLVILNPPFSRRDKKTYVVVFNGNKYCVSVATAFVINSLPFMSQGGCLLAVLPDGCLVSTADAPVWQEVNRLFKFEVVRDNARSEFEGVSARTCLVRLYKRTEHTLHLVPNEVKNKSKFKIERGTCQMHTRRIKCEGNSAPLVHTTHLKKGRVAHSDEIVFGKTIEGPALLFPRVGRITPEKVCLLEEKRVVVLSDCVLALPCTSFAASENLHTQIISKWSIFSACYRGTGAPYITVDRATHALSKIITVDKKTMRGVSMGNSKSLGAAISLVDI